MSEDTVQATAQDVLRCSELNARLLRRLTAPLGVIDVRMFRQIPARPIGLLAPLVSLFDDLMARYGIDDGSMGNQPLVMGQPWMQNVSSYLTNYNSFSSTTNQFISIPATEQKTRAEIGKIFDERSVAEVEPRLFHPKSFILPPDHSSSRAEAFRVLRRPARRPWESDPATAHASVPAKDEYRPDKDEQPGVSETSDLKSGMAKVIAAVIPPPGDLPLAQAQVQVKLPDKGAAFQPQPAKADQLVPAKASVLKQTTAPRNRSTEDGHTSAEQSTDEDKETRSRSNDVSREIVAPSLIRANLEGFDLVQSQTASSQVPKLATDFVWRRNADVPTARELRSDDAGARQKAVGDSLPQVPRGRQTIRPESISRKSEPGVGSRLMTERIVRNISRKLIIERERRGY